MRTIIIHILIALSALLFACRENSVLPTETGTDPDIISETGAEKIPAGTWEAINYVDIDENFEAKITLEVTTEGEVKWIYKVSDKDQPVETTIFIETTNSYENQYVSVGTIRVNRIPFIMRNADLLVYHPYFKIINGELHLFYGEIYNALDPIDQADMIRNKWNHNLNFFLYEGAQLTTVRYIENIEFENQNRGTWFRQYFNGPINFNGTSPVLTNSFNFTRSTDNATVRLGKDIYSRANINREYEIDGSTLRIHDTEPTVILRRVVGNR